jgi:hypothetical protein
MMPVPPAPGASPPADPQQPDRPHAGWGTNLATALLAAWLVAGVYVDGWAHNTRPTLETFLTPWHGLLYSGYTVTALWIGHQATRHRTAGRPWPDGIPHGYGLGLLGAAAFGLGGLADAAWHALRGVEADLQALLSPPHLLLFTAGLAIVSTPARAAWAQPITDRPRSAGLRQFLPTGLSIALTTAFVVFFTQYAAAFSDDVTTFTATAASTVGPAVQATSPLLLQVVGVMSVLLTTLILMAALLVTLTRWDPPPGAATLLFATTAILSAALLGFAAATLIGATILGGFAADLLIQRTRPPAARPPTLCLIATVVPLVLWTAYFAILALSGTLAWPVELWAGTTIMATLTSLALAGLLTLAPPDNPPTSRPNSTAPAPRDQKLQDSSRGANPTGAPDPLGQPSVRG